LEFRNVTFAYPGHSESPVIRNVSFTAKAGETVAFIGSTGSGKSTLIQLIPRFYDVTEGQVSDFLSDLDKQMLHYEIPMNLFLLVLLFFQDCL
jgi:ABC-type multidrug transport system fused ATPase/permease subunit